MPSHVAQQAGRAGLVRGQGRDVQHRLIAGLAVARDGPLHEEDLPDMGEAQPGRGGQYHRRSGASALIPPMRFACNAVSRT